MQTFNLTLFGDRYGGFHELMQTLPYYPVAGKVWVAGGAIRRTLLKQPLDSDIDYFFASEPDFQDTKQHFEGGLYKITEKKESANNVQYTLDIEGKKVIVQLIHIAYYANVEVLLDSFDFTLCQCATDGENLYFGDYSLFDIAGKRLVVHKIKFPVASLRRLIKYTQQGFYACNGCLRQMLASVAVNPGLLENNTTYID